MRLGGRTWEQWVAQYGTSHRNPVNRWCHTVGIPFIVVSLMAAPLTLVRFGMWKVSLALFIAGWTLQFAGHAFEGKPPEFFRDWRFLLVGVRWWAAKIRGRA